jgi:hypothetical protein
VLPQSFLKKLAPFLLGLEAGLPLRIRSALRIVSKVAPDLRGDLPVNWILLSEGLSLHDLASSAFIAG